MAKTRDDAPAQDLQSRYQRWTMDAGDVLLVDFTKGPDGRPQPHLHPSSYFNTKFGVQWLVTPEAGASVSIAEAFRPDYDVTVNAHFNEHGVHPSVTTVTGYNQDAPVSALRFTAVTAGAVIEIRSPAEVRVS